MAVVAGTTAFEMGRFEPREVAWATTETELASFDGDLLVGRSQAHDVQVEARNVRVVRALLEWEDDAGAADAFTLRLEGPGGRVGSARGAEGSVEVEVAVAEPPATVLAASARSAAVRQAYEAPDASAVGAWRATVTLDDAPGAGGPAGAPVGGAQDGANAYRARVVLVGWAPPG